MKAYTAKLPIQMTLCYIHCTRSSLIPVITYAAVSLYRIMIEIVRADTLPKSYWYHYRQ